MRPNFLPNVGLFLLAVIFSVGLMFAFTEIPRLLDGLIQARIPTPHSDPAYDPLRIELFYQAFSIRLIGYLCLGVILAFVIIGFATRQTGWALVGGVSLFLPVFATFAHSMFYLAGLGLFNIILFPLLDISLSLIDLGKVVLIPYWMLIWIFGLFNFQLHNFLAYIFMGAGAFIFIMGVFAWLQARWSSQKIAKNWIYHYSRHPQYLGWIIWSYGLMLYGPSLNQMKKSWGWQGTLPWLLSTLVIIGICLLEEIKMKERAQDDYKIYRSRTPFLFPIPGLLKKIIKIPMRLVIHKDHPEKRKEVGLVIALYAILFMGISLFWVDLVPGDNESILASRAYSQVRADSLVTEIRKPIARRYRDIKPFGELFSMGNETYPILMRLIEDRDPEVREFAIQATCKYQIREAIPALLKALQDSEFRVVRSAIHALGEMDARQATDTLCHYLEYPREGVSQDLLLTALSKMECKKILPFLEKRLEDSIWYRHTTALRSMMRVDFESAKPYIYKSLQDERVQVRREAVNMLLETLPEDAVPYLENVINDDDWDVRFYARQAIEMIWEKHDIQL